MPMIGIIIISFIAGLTMMIAIDLVKNIFKLIKR